jgi:hypothetical protein
MGCEICPRYSSDQRSCPRFVGFGLRLLCDRSCQEFDSTQSVKNTLKSKPGRVFGTRELIIPKVGKSTYVVVYRVAGDAVQILQVLAGTRDIDTILAEGFDEEG